MEYPEWAAAGKRLGAAGRCVQWALGDWIRYGNSAFGERYARAARITGYDVQTLMNMVYVASRFEVSRRRETLSWSHHEAVASAEPEEQDYWLDKACAQRFSVSDLRLEVRTSRKRPKEAAADACGDESQKLAEELTCPHCGKVVPLPPKRIRASRTVGV